MMSEGGGNEKVIMEEDSRRTRRAHTNDSEHKLKHKESHPSY